MNKLSKDKRNQLILIALGTVGVIAALYFLVISGQQAEIARINSSIEATAKDIDKMQQVRKSADKIEAQLTECQARLSSIESTMPSGDWYLWVNSTLRKFNDARYQVDIPVVGAPMASGVDLIPNFPYNQLSVKLNGSAYYDDFGKFASDFENHFPCMRIENLTLDPGNGVTPEEREKLNFHMEISSLTKPNAQ
jgi:Tfp pilus assembly protein PilO